MRAFIHRNDQRASQDQAFQKFLDHQVAGKAGQQQVEFPRKDDGGAVVACVVGLMFAFQMFADLACAVGRHVGGDFSDHAVLDHAAG